MKYVSAIVVTVLGIALVVVGFLNHQSLMAYSLQQVPDVSFVTTASVPQGNPALLVIAIALIPFGYTLLDPVRSLPRALLYVAFTTACGCCFWWLGICHLQELVEYLRVDRSAYPSITVSKLRFEYYAMVGILAGISWSIVLMKFVNKRNRDKRVPVKLPNASLIDQNDQL